MKKEQLKEALLFLISFAVVSFLVLLLLSSCKPKEDLKIQFCYGQDGFIPGELACHLLQGLPAGEEAFLCFPQQVFQGNCTWQPVDGWLELCTQPMPHSQEQFIVKFCHRPAGLENENVQY